MNLMQLPDEYQNDLQGRDGRCYYHEVLLFQGKEEWKKEWKKNKNLRLQTNIVPELASTTLHWNILWVILDLFKVKDICFLNLSLPIYSTEIPKPMNCTEKEKEAIYYYRRIMKPREKNTSLEKKGKLLRVLLSGRWLPGKQGWLNFWETKLVTLRKSLHRSCRTELTCQGILLP